MPEQTETPHRRRARIDRRPVLVAVAVVIVVGLLVGRGNGEAGRAVAAGASGPEVAPAAALTSSWFCAGATDTAAGAAPGNLILANRGRRSVAGTVTVVGDNGARTTSPVIVPGGSRVVVPETVTGGADWVGAMVDLLGGQVAVEQEITSPLGVTATPCATSGSSTWYFANGATLINASSTLTLLNPYASDAIVDLDFTTNEGVEQPGAFQSLAVPAGGVLAVDLGSHLRRRSAIATTVSVTSGRVVAWKTDVATQAPAGTPILGTTAAGAPNADPATPFLGVTETLGAPARSTSWYWPEGGSSSGVSDRYVIYNPGPGSAELRFDVSLDQGSLEPYSLPLGPDDVVSLGTGGAARIPTGVGYAASLRSTDGVGVVAERVVAAGAPASFRGTGEVLGATGPADQWLVAAGHAGPRLQEAIVVSNPGGRAVTVQAMELLDGRLAPVPGVTVGRLGPGRRLLWNLGVLDPGFSSAVDVEASGPVVVGRDLIGLGRASGVSLALGVPVP